MKRIIIILQILIIFNFFIFSVQEKVIEEKNIYNGKTTEIVYKKFQAPAKKIKKVLKYYDENNRIVKVDQYLSDELIKEREIIRQIDYYNINGIIEKYEILYHEDKVKVGNIDRIVEYVDERDKVIKVEHYYNDKLIHIDNSPGLIKDNMNYQFMTLSFSKNFVLDANKLKSADTDFFYLFDMKYLRGRTYVKYLNKIEDMNEIDYNYLNAWCKTLNADNIKKLYKRKILVEENNEQYWVLMQDQLFDYLKEEKEILLYYYLGGLNENVMLISVGFIDKKQDGNL